MVGAQINVGAKKKKKKKNNHNFLITLSSEEAVGERFSVLSRLRTVTHMWTDVCSYVKMPNPYMQFAPELFLTFSAKLIHPGVSKLGLWLSTGMQLSCIVDE